METIIKSSLTGSFLSVICFMFLFAYAEPAAQTTGSIRGVVTDSANAEALAYASVYIQELKAGTYTDSRGYFVIASIPSDKTFLLSVSYTGYHTRMVSFKVSPGKMTHIEIKMTPSSILLPAVETIGKKIPESNATDISTQHISIKQLELLPKGVETDIFRSLHNIPGVKATGDVSARYYIRGGASNQNLVQMNGATIYNPFHALGLFSVIDPELVNSAEFFKGGFPSEYGGRLSSILNISTKDGNKNSFGSKISASWLSLKALIEGPIPGGSFIITGRGSYSNEVYKKFLGKDLPLDFYDAAFKANISKPFGLEGSKLILHGFTSKDEMNHSNPLLADLSWANNIFGINWLMTTGSPLFIELSFSSSLFEGEVKPNKSQAKPKGNEVKDAQMRMDFHYVYDSRDEIGVGLNILNLNTKLFLKNLYGIPSDIGTHGTNMSVYGKYKFMRFDKLGIDLGTRINLTGLAQKTGSFFFEPRFSFTYRPVAWTALKGAWGIFQQEVTTLSDENEIISLFEPWIITPASLGPSKAAHYITGLEVNFSNSASLELEAYYKKCENIAALNPDKINRHDKDLISGSGESYGFESMLKLDLFPVSFTGSYSLSWAYNNVQNWIYYPKFDARHSCSLTLEYAFSEGWQFSAVWTFSTGMPFTPVSSYYNKLKIDDFYAMGSIFSSFSSFAILSDKNTGRLPDYHRLDISISKKLRAYFLNLNMDVSIMNVYDRKNLFYFERESGRRINMLPFFPAATLKIEL